MIAYSAARDVVVYASQAPENGAWHNCALIAARGLKETEALDIPQQTGISQAHALRVVIPKEFQNMARVCVTGLSLEVIYGKQ